MGSHVQDVQSPSPHLHDEQHRQAPEEDRVYLEETAGQQAIGLSAQEHPPGSVHGPRNGAAPPSAHDPPRRGPADLVTKPAQLAVHLRYPRAGFSRASRNTRPRISWLIRGRPGRFGYVHLCVTSPRCQASSVRGVTSR
jgi:hypothetical protein